VIVVDDGSRDETAAIVMRHEPFARLIRNASSDGAGAARNRGVAAARAPVLAFIDADCFPTARWLACGLEAITRADIVQGIVLPDPNAIRSPFDRTLVVDREGGFYQTANLLVRREVFETVGGFRDWALERPRRRRQSRRRAIPPVGEDTLFAWTARRMGACSEFAPDVLVHHAVVSGDVRDAMAGRWLWARDMPGLARLVPELRDGTFYRRWFFADWTAKFDLAAGGVIAVLLTRRRPWLLALIPYLERVRREAMLFRVGPEPRPIRVRKAMLFALGSPAVDAATLAGLIAGSITWRSLVL
jgi:glycosyltransferase involved in cell wall biosynthesis